MIQESIPADRVYCMFYSDTHFACDCNRCAYERLVTPMQCSKRNSVIVASLKNCSSISIIFLPMPLTDYLCLCGVDSYYLVERIITSLNSQLQRSQMILRSLIIIRIKTAFCLSCYLFLSLLV
jgi:hypothetical protein